MCIGGEPNDEKRGDAGGEHEEPPQTSERLSPHLMQYTPPGVRVAAHKYGDRVTKQEVRSAVEVSKGRGAREANPTRLFIPQKGETALLRDARNHPPAATPCCPP